MNAMGSDEMMKRQQRAWRSAIARCSWVIVGLVLGFGGLSSGEAEERKVRLMIVDSYHREYLWSKSTQTGLASAMLKYGYLDNQQEADALAANDAVESSRAIIRKEWMDTKRKDATNEIAESTARISKAIAQFKPDLLLLGDDNATNYIGNQFLDTEIPIIFWGLNNWPVKYGLLDSMENPGHNVTGVWQSGYYRESLQLLHELVPTARTFAILACNSETSRAKIKEIMSLDVEKQLPLDLVGVVKTNSFTEFQSQVRELLDSVDAFFVVNHDTMKDDMGKHVDMLKVGRWYLEHVQKPETSDEAQFVQEGMLCTADDSGFNQSFEAFQMAVEILEKHITPSTMAPRTPQRGPLTVNRQRLRTLGLTVGPDVHVDQFIEEAAALQNAAANTP